MTTYREYQNQIEELQRKAATARKEEIGTTIRDIKKKIAEFGLTAADLGLAAPAAPRRAAKPVDKAAPAEPKGARKKRRSTARAARPAPPPWRVPGWARPGLASG